MTKSRMSLTNTFQLLSLDHSLMPLCQHFDLIMIAVNGDWNKVVFFKNVQCFEITSSESCNPNSTVACDLSQTHFLKICDQTS